MMNKTNIKRFIKRFDFARDAYVKIRAATQSYDIPEIYEMNIRKSIFNDKMRINLLVPSVNQEHVFGGISTALTFFDDLKNEVQCDARIITVDAEANHKNVLSEEYKIVNAADDSKEKYQLVSFANRNDKTIPVREKDVFVATAWWTAYIIKEIIIRQADLYKQRKKPFIYLIQDFEPGFYPWSSKYLLSESTYARDADVWAVFNSEELSVFFKNNHYRFQNQWVFQPVFNQKLKEILLNSEKKVVKKKKILIYGRPNTPRNAFEFIIEGLKKWTFRQKDIHEWEVYSAGEKHANIDIGNGIVIKPVGKLSLKDYAAMLKESFIGISLMVSPHPSYPPLEMSVFGLKTITNVYHNKNLQYFNDNIINLEFNTPETLALTLERLCNGFNCEAELLIDNRFVRENNQFYNIVKDIHSKLFSI